MANILKGFQHIFVIGSAFLFAAFALYGWVTFLGNVIASDDLTSSETTKLGPLATTNAPRDELRDELYTPLWSYVPGTPSKDEYRTNQRFLIDAIDYDTIRDFCGPKALACARPYAGRIFLPNPCGSLWKTDLYAALLCHEMAHLKGWEHEKEDDWHEVTRRDE